MGPCSNWPARRSCRAPSSRGGAWPARCRNRVPCRCTLAPAQTRSLKRKPQPRHRTTCLRTRKSSFRLGSLQVQHPRLLQLLSLTNFRRDKALRDAAQDATGGAATRALADHQHEARTRERGRNFQQHAAHKALPQGTGTASQRTPTLETRSHHASRRFMKLRHESCSTTASKWWQTRRTRADARSSG